MSGEYKRIFGPGSPTASFRGTSDKFFDGGNYSQLNVNINVLKAGTAGNISLEHSAIPENEGFIPLAGTPVALNATSNTFVQITAFLRYIRPAADAAVAGSPICVIDIVAKN